MGNTLGLLFTIDADPSHAEEAVQAFAAQTGQSIGLVQAQMADYRSAETAAYAEAAERMRGSADVVNESLMSNRESAVVLNEELGIRMPRGIVGAVGEMLPAIELIGPALIAAFAVEEIYKFYEALEHTRDVMNGVTLAQQEQKIALEQNKSVIEEAARKNVEYAQSEVKVFAADIAILKERNEQLRQANSTYMDSNPIIGAVKEAWEKYGGTQKEVEANNKQIIELEKTLGTLTKIVGEDEDKAVTERLRKAKELAAELERQAKHEWELEYQATEQSIRERARAEAAVKKEAEEVEKTKRAWADYSDGLKLPKENMELFIADGEKLTKTLLGEQNAFQIIGPQLGKLGLEFDKLDRAEDLYAGRVEHSKSQIIEAHRAATVASVNHLVAEARNLSQLSGDWSTYAAAVVRANQLIAQSSEDAAHAHRDEVLAQAEATAAAGASLLQTLGYRKAAAYVEMVMQTAAGFGSLADQDYWGAAQHFISAAEYAIIANQSVSAAGGGSASAGAGARAGTASPQAVAGSPNVLAPGSAGAAQAASTAATHGPITIHVNFNGSVYSGPGGINELAKQIAEPVAKHLTDIVGNRDVKLLASHVVNPAPVSRGRS